MNRANSDDKHSRLISNKSILILFVEIVSIFKMYLTHTPNKKYFANDRGTQKKKTEIV